MKFLKLILFIISIGALTSCVTQQACNRKYPPKIINKDSIVIRDSIITLLVHDTIFVVADTIHDSVPVYNDNGILNSNKIIRELELCKATSQVVNGQLTLVLMQKEAALDSILKHNIKIKNKVVYKTTTRVVTKYIKHWYSNIANGLALIALGIFLFISARFILTIIRKIP